MPRPAFLPIPLLVTFALVIAGSWLPDVRLWGVNHLAYHPTWLRLVALCAIAVIFVPRIARGEYARLVREVGRLASRRRRKLVIALFAAAAVGLCVVVASATALLGDGIYAAANVRTAIEKGLTPPQYARLVTPSEHVYPGTDLLNFTAGYIADKAGVEPLWGVRILNALLGGLFVVTLLAYATQSRDAPALRVTITLLALTSGAVQLFFGYVEYYTPLAIVGTLFVVTAFRVLRGSGSPLGLLILFVLGFAFHVQALLLAPGLVFVAAWWLWLRKRDARAIRAVALAVVAGSIAAVVAVWQGPLARFMLPLRPDEATYGVFSFAHLVDVVNLLFLVMPAWVLFTVLWMLTRPRTNDTAGEDAAETAFALCLFVPAAMFLLVFKPELGMARDWDLFCLTAFGLFVPAYVALRRFVAGRSDEEQATVLAPAILLSVVLACAWIGVNASGSRSAARYESILTYDETNAGYAYESLSQFYEDRGDVVAQTEAVGQAYAHTRNPRYLLKLGMLSVAAGDTVRAIGGLYEALHSRPRYEDARRYLIMLLARRNDTNGLLGASREGTELHPDEPYYYYVLGRTYLSLGFITEAQAAFRECVARNPSDEMLAQMSAMIRAWEKQTGEE